MRAGFEHYLRPKEDEYKRIWDEGLFVFDANVLLDLYRYTEKSRKDVLERLKTLKQKVWLPHQIADEFHRRREKVVFDQRSDLNKIESFLSAAVEQTRDQVKRRAPSISADLVNKTASGVRALITSLRQNLKINLVNLDNDQVFAVLEEVFSGRVGAPYPGDQLEKLYAEAKDRMEKKIPPGFEDKGKPEPERYGDYIWWSQLLSHNEEKKKPIVIVTNDAKGDWWRRSEEEAIGPRYELLTEMHQRTGQPMLMYSLLSFLDYHGKYTQKPVDESVRQEVDAVSASYWAGYWTTMRLLGRLPTIPRHIVEQARGDPSLTSLQYRDEYGNLFTLDQEFLRFIREGPNPRPKTKPTPPNELHPEDDDPPKTSP